MRSTWVSGGLAMLVAAASTLASAAGGPAQAAGATAPRPEALPRGRDPGRGAWRLVAPEKLAAECKLDLAALKRAEATIGAPFAVVRYGKLCYEYYPSGRDASTHVFSASKTLGALAVGAAIQQSKPIPVTSVRKQGPLQEFQRIDHWLDDFAFHRDATVAHVLGSVAAASADLTYPNREWRYDTRGLEALNRMSDVINLVVAQDRPRLGNNIGEFWTRHFAAPLGLENSTWGDSNDTKIFGYSWNATVRDMARVGLLMLNGGVWNGERIIDEQFLYDLSHPAFEDGNPIYGYLAWLNGPDDCAPKPVHRRYPHGPVSGAPDCLDPAGCAQTHDDGVFAASGARGQYIGVHRGLDMVLVVKDLGDPQKAKDGFVWAAIRPAVLAHDKVYAGDEAGFCKAYARGDYAPDLRRWPGGR